jgi:hypothetical protein
VNKCKTNYFCVEYGYEMPRFEISLIPYVSDRFNRCILDDHEFSMGDLRNDGPEYLSHPEIGLLEYYIHCSIILGEFRSIIPLITKC